MLKLRVGSVKALVLVVSNPETRERFSAAVSKLPSELRPIKQVDRVEFWGGDDDQVLAAAEAVAQDLGMPLQLD